MAVVDVDADVLALVWLENSCGDRKCMDRRLRLAIDALRLNHGDAHGVKEEVMSSVAEKEPAPTTAGSDRPFEESVQAQVIADAKAWSVAEWHRLVKDLRERAEMGKSKYNTYLYTDNGRNTGMDAYQEGLDFANYFKMWLLEWPNTHEGAGAPSWLLVSYSTFLNTLGAMRREVHDD